MTNPTEVKPDFVVISVEATLSAVTIEFTVDGEAKSKRYAIVAEEKAEDIKNYFASSDKEFAFSDAKKLEEAGIIKSNKELLEDILGTDPTTEDDL